MSGEQLGKCLFRTLTNDTDREDNLSSGYQSKRGTSGGHRISTRSEWAYDQKELLKTLEEWGLVKGVARQVKYNLIPSDVCIYVENGVRCTKIAQPNSRSVRMCEYHKKEHTRKQWRERKRRQRAKSHE